MNESEVVVYQYQTRVVRRLGQGFGVAVEGHEPPPGRKSGKYFAAVAASSEGGVDIAAVGIRDDGVHAGMQQYRLMIFSHCEVSTFARGFPQWQ